MTAIEAPMPNLPVPLCAAVALERLSAELLALSSTAPASVIVMSWPRLGMTTVAVDSTRPTLRASEPAMPVSPPLEPDFALAPI